MSDLDDGATVVEFAAAVTFVVALFLGVAQLAVYAYAGNVARHAAMEGARAGAEVGRPDSDGAVLARDLLAHSLGATGRRFLVASTRSRGVSEVIVSGHAPRLVPFAPVLPVSRPQSRYDGLDSEARS